MQNNQLVNMLTILLGIMIGILIILSMVFLIVSLKNRQTKTGNGQSTKNNKKTDKNEKNQTNMPKSYTKESIFKFMEFDNISNNMIIQKEGKRFLSIIECQGINFDLMSGLEKNSVEQGFLQFLNTLRYPVQIYVQTRTVNLEGSINTYKDRVDTVARQYRDKQMEYNQKLRSGQYTEKQLQKEELELARQKNLYEYGIDIVNNTERMSLNKNILSKHYYVIIPYYAETSPDEHYTKDEIVNIAFSELYTKAQAIINSLAVCGINSKILDSTELAELLYVAYNRDESETFNIQRALNAGYEDLYSTAPDVLDKRMRELDIKIEQDAIKKANETVYDVLEENEKQKRVKQREAKLDELIDEMAKSLIEDNRNTVGYDVAEQAIEKINEEEKQIKETKEEGGEKNDKKKTVTRRATTKSI